jgi:hypothetical protein
VRPALWPDCQFNEGHDLGRIPADEILQTRVEALVYREYLDPEYTTPNPVALVPGDAIELPWSRWVPGAVIWARPGERLCLQVRNGDPHEFHSLHVHGLQYGIDSDGAWPRGVTARNGRRSDEILAGQTCAVEWATQSMCLRRSSTGTGTGSRQ